MADVLIVRQPIFDDRNQLAGYELRYRPSGADVPAASDGRALIAGLLNVGLDQLVGGARAFIALTHELLMAEVVELLDPSRVTVELREAPPRDAATVAALSALRERGFTVAVGDFAAAPEQRDLLQLAEIVRVDVSRYSDPELAALAATLGEAKVTRLAVRVDDARTAERCLALGFKLLQGENYSRSQIVKRRDLPTAMTGIARLMNVVLDPTVSDREIEEAFRADPGLSIKLLRIVNSAAIGGRDIESIQHAIRLIGRAPLHRWLALLFTAAVPRSTDVELELVVGGLACGRLCELLALNSGRERAAPSVFLTGLLSSFDAILGLPIRELLQQVRVAPEVESALLHQDGPYTPYLTLAQLYADGLWDEALVLASEMGVEDDLPIWYAQAGGWARNVLAR
jgi:c-di-GMP phosphodiesterase